MDLAHIGQYGNYIEVVLVPNLSRPDHINVDEVLFHKMMNVLRQTSQHPLQRHFKEYIYRNLVYEINDQHQIQVFKKRCGYQANVPDSNVHVFVYHREKQAYHSFPSTTMIHSVSYVDRATFKINNRLFLNFEKKIYENNKNNETFYKIFINYNHDNNVDISTMQSSLQHLTNRLQSIFTSSY